MPVWANILIAVISACVPAIASIMVNRAANETMLRKHREDNDANRKLIVYRIDQLENKVNKHNELIERMYQVEGRVAIMERELQRGRA